MNSETIEVTYPPETVPETTAATEPVYQQITVIDYTPLIYDSTSDLANVFLFGCCLIAGVICAIRLWGVRPS